MKKLTFLPLKYSDPEAAISWTKDGQPIDLSKYTTTTKSTTSTKVVKESVLTLTNIQSSDYATYKCIAGNVAGEVSQEEILNVHCK